MYILTSNVAYTLLFVEICFLPVCGLFSAAQTSPVPTVAGRGDIANAQISRKPDVTAMGGYAWAFSPITAAAWRAGTGAGASWAPMPIDAEASEITLTAKAVTGPPKQVGLIVDFFTSATSFANPAITIGRMFSDTFAGIAPASAPAFIGAQLVGAAIGLLVVRLLFPVAAPDPAVVATADARP